jgi:hypothetical protein
MVLMLVTARSIADGLNDWLTLVLDASHETSF